MSDDQPSDGLDSGGLAAGSGYEPPRLSVYESEAPAEWAVARAGESAPDAIGRRAFSGCRRSASRSMMSFTT